MQNNLFPSISPDVLEEAEQEQEEVFWGRSWKFDIQAREFVTTPTGKVVEADEMEAYIQWCYAALNTPRYRHVIYSRSHGHEFDDIIGKDLTREAIESEIKRIVTETLMVSRRTSSVSNFRFRWESDALYYTCDVTTARGDTFTLSERVEAVV
ncbi:DUF2634 domain-containing protein [Brevibacillus borstelensis]|uniref:DUF2634 domain-containing protein n=1 Tax=Brevibacillus borstelensis TaxID=45462 RepID=UPI002E243413|nr:DUF2634 domain-containing protein [Brevibacillus borstelensis]